MKIFKAFDPQITQIPKKRRELNLNESKESDQGI
jgi:hypothetical protein